MSQHMIDADFVAEPKPCYITDNTKYARAMKDEWEAMTRDKYKVMKREVFVVVKVE
jgi:hypothetical protein